MTEARSPPPTVGTFTLWRVFWRSLFLQAAWNPKGMQNIGFAYALYPALAELYPDPDRLQEATERHLCCFNTHPYAAAAIVGGAIYHEERIARGEEPPEAVNLFKQSLMGPLAALGDGFFWFSLRPAAGAFAALMSLVVGLWGAVVYLVGYNAVHLALRARFFVAGHRMGDEVVSAIAASRLPFFGERLRGLAAASAGAVAGLASLSFPRAHGAWAVLGAWGLFAAAYVLLAKGASPYALAYGAAALALFIGLVF
ncbi:MAG: PTS system mannose/fructose/sorbose family transporter subunit IID [Myxococcales bacterium]|jgi:PTS system mannose-specific IID component